MQIDCSANERWISMRSEEIMTADICETVSLNRGWHSVIKVNHLAAQSQTERDKSNIALQFAIIMALSLGFKGVLLSI